MITIKNDKQDDNQENNQEQDNMIHQQNSQTIKFNTSKNFSCKKCYNCLFDFSKINIFTAYICIISSMILILEIIGMYIAPELTNPPVIERYIRIIFCCIVIICILIITSLIKDEIFLKKLIISKTLSIFALAITFICFILNYVGYYTQLNDYDLVDSVLDCYFNYRCSNYFNDEQMPQYEECWNDCLSDSEKFNETKWRDEIEGNEEIIEDVWINDNIEIQLKQKIRTICNLVHVISIFLWISLIYIWIIVIIKLHKSIYVISTSERTEEVEI